MFRLWRSGMHKLLQADQVAPLWPQENLPQLFRLMTDTPDTVSIVPPENPARSLRQWEAFFARWGREQEDGKKEYTLDDF